MTTINQLPQASTVAQTDAIPLQQAGDGITRFATPPQLIAPEINVANGVAGTDAANTISGQTAIASGASQALSLGQRFSVSKFVEDFGVVHDPLGASVLANTIAYQAALNAAGGVARLTHRAGLTVFVTGLTFPSHTTWIIDGLLKLAPGNNPAQFPTWNTNISNCSLTGSGTIDGNAAAQTGTISGGLGGVYTNTNFVVEGLTFQNFKNWPFNMVACHDAYAIRCQFLNSGNSAEYASSGTNCWFISCKASGIADLGLGFYGGINGGGAINCTVTACTAGGVFVLADAGQPAICQNLLFSGNECYSNLAPGIVVAVNGGLSVLHTGIKITNNTAYLNSGGGILVYSVNGFSVSDNLVYSNVATVTAGADINIAQNTSNGVIENNKVINPQTGGVTGVGLYWSRGLNTLVKNNTFIDNQVTPSMKYCINGPVTPPNLSSVATGNTYFNYITAAFIPGDTVPALRSRDYDAVLRQSVGQDIVGGAFQVAYQLLSATLSGLSAPGPVFGYNLSGGEGESDIVMVRPAGAAGGLRFWDQAVGGNPAALGKLDNGGNLSLNGSIAAGTTLVVGGIAGPNLSTGTAVPGGSYVQPKGSVYLRSAGALGSTIYVTQGAGVWNPVAGV